MRTVVLSLMLLGAALAAQPASAEIGTADSVPAATLLLPYFEVDLNDPGGITTLFSVNNASAAAVMGHVTLWTDQGIPTLNFDVSLTGYDVQTFNVRDLMGGLVPATGCAPPVLTPAAVASLRAAHTGQAATGFGGLCVAANYGDGLARGYVTVDTVNACNLAYPSDTGYFTTYATFQNVLWGDYFYVNPAENFAQGDVLVHVEACDTGASPYIGYVGNGAGHCPFSAGDYTFYGRYVAAVAADQREPLATTFATRYINGGAFSGGTSLLVWRDTKTLPAGINGPHACGGSPAWFPLVQNDAVAFDEQENPTDQCFLTDNVGPAIGGTQPCFPLATQRIRTAGGNVIAADMSLASPFGWLYLNLNHTLAVGDPYPGSAQAWVTTVMDAQGRFSVGFSAVQLDNPLTGLTGGSIILP